MWCGADTNLSRQQQSSNYDSSPPSSHFFPPTIQQLVPPRWRKVRWGTALRPALSRPVLPTVQLVPPGTVPQLVPPGRTFSRRQSWNVNTSRRVSPCVSRRQSNSLCLTLKVVTCFTTSRRVPPCVSHQQSNSLCLMLADTRLGNQAGRGAVKFGLANCAYGSNLNTAKQVRVCVTSSPRQLRLWLQPQHK